MDETPYLIAEASAIESAALEKHESYAEALRALALEVAGLRRERDEKRWGPESGDEEKGAG